MLSFRVGNIFSAFWSSILRIFVLWDCRTSCKFDTSSSLIMVRGLGEIMPYKNANILSQLFAGLHGGDTQFPRGMRDLACTHTHTHTHTHNKH